MKKTKVKFSMQCYGVIRSIENETIHARIYDAHKHKIIDDITFSIHEFCPSDKKMLELWTIFTWNVGYIGKKAFSTFRLKKFEKYEGIAMGKERSIALSLKCYDMLMNDYDDNMIFVEAE